MKPELTRKDQEMENRLLENYISIARAVGHSGYSSQYLRRLIRDKKIHGIKFSHFWMVDVQSLNAYIAKARREEDRRFGPRQVLEQEAGRSTRRK